MIGDMLCFIAIEELRFGGGRIYLRFADFATNHQSCIPLARSNFLLPIALMVIDVPRLGDVPISGDVNYFQY